MYRSQISIPTIPLVLARRVRLPVPRNGYNYGELTGVMVGEMYEVRLPSGLLIYIYSGEFEQAI